MSSDVLDHLDKLSNSVSSMQKIFDCPICLDMLKDPVRTTSCGHTFCRMCITMVLRKLTKEPCPICKTLLSHRNIVADEKMTVFVELILELISAINSDIGLDVTAHIPRPISTNEASQDSEEFFKSPEGIIEPKINVEKSVSALQISKVDHNKNNSRLACKKGPTEKLNKKMESENTHEKSTSVQKSSTDFNFLKPPNPAKNVLKRKQPKNRDKTNESISNDERKVFKNNETGKINSLGGLKNNSKVVQGSLKQERRLLSTRCDTQEGSKTAIKVRTSDRKKIMQKKLKDSLAQCSPNDLAKTSSSKLVKKMKYSSFMPKSPNDRTAKFYFITSLVMRRKGQKPVSMMKRHYPVAPPPGEVPVDSKQQLESSKVTKSDCKAYTSVCVQTSPVKLMGKSCQNCTKQKKIIFEANEPQSKDISEKGIDEDRPSSDSDKPDPKSNCPIDETNEVEMDMFEDLNPAVEQVSKEMKIDPDLNDGLALSDEEATQPNPYIRSKRNICTRKPLSQKYIEMSSMYHKLSTGKKKISKPNSNDANPSVKSTKSPNIENYFSSPRKILYLDSSNSNLENVKSPVNDIGVTNDLPVQESPTRKQMNRNNDSICSEQTTDKLIRTKKNGTEESQSKTISQKDPLNVGFSGSMMSDAMDTQQINALEEECVRLEGEYASEHKKEKEQPDRKESKDAIDQVAVTVQENHISEKQPVVIECSDDEIPATPPKKQACEILTQSNLNASKLEKSFIESQNSIVQSSLEVAPVTKLQLAIQQSLGSPKTPSTQKNKSPLTDQARVKSSAKKTEKRRMLGSGLLSLIKKKKYSFVYSRLNDVQQNKLEKFAQKFDAEITANITQHTTHVILVPDEKNRAPHTYKYLKGVAQRLWIVSMDWITSSLIADKVLPEERFVTLDSSGEPGPWRCKNVEELPLSKFVIIPKSPYNTISHDQLKDLILLCGAEVVDDLKSLGNLKFDKPRILLTDDELEIEFMEKQLEENMLIPVHVEWLLEVIGHYKPLPLSPHLHDPINREILRFLLIPDDLIIDDSECEDEEDDDE